MQSRKYPHPGMKTHFMKRFLLLISPLVLFMLAFRPIGGITVTGKITDEKGIPVNGASIVVKGTQKGTSTAADGVYRLSGISADAILQVSAIGFESQEIKVGGRTTLPITLRASVTTMSEVVVIGYGAQRKRDITGSVTRLYSPAQYNAGQPIQGKIAGVQVSNGYLNNTIPEFDREGYDRITENGFLRAADNPLSTFSIDVDAASYSNVRRYLNMGQLPPPGAVRIEEMVNYFKYDYLQPRGDNPFSIHTEISDAPWNPNHKLVLIGLQGKKVPAENLPASNLVFLIDVSGSMQGPERLGLVKASMKMLVDQLREQDRVAVVVYAGAAGLALPSTSGNFKQVIKDAIDNLQAGGSTAGGAGIRLAYKTARDYFIQGGNNRVILCTDGDFNVGESSDDAMERLIEEERKSGVFLTVLGYGMGNYQDAKMQKLADKGNGNHAYIDGMSEAKKVLVNEFGGTLFTIAKDVKLQVEFNPSRVAGYRLIGYENRMLAKEDFNDDKKDAGELGSGHTVTALYEVIPAGVNSDFLKSVDPLKYQQKEKRKERTNATDEILTVKFRYKAPDGDISKLMEVPVKDKAVSLEAASNNFRFAAAVAGFGLLLRNSEYKSKASYEKVLELARKALADDEQGYRAEFIRLVENAALLSKGKVKDVPEEADTRR